MASQESIFEQWKRAGPTILVPMGSVRFAAFRQNQAIGTENLGSCSVVVIASTSGAILAHIPPLPNTSSAAKDPLAGDKNVKSMMNEIKTSYSHYKTHGYFPESETFVVCAWYKDAYALPDQLNIMRQSLKELVSTPVIQTYDVPVDQKPGKGTVIIIGNLKNGETIGKPFVYAEDKLISSGPKEQATSSGPVQSAGSHSSKSVSSHGQAGTSQAGTSQAGQSAWELDSASGMYKRWDGRAWLWGQYQGSKWIERYFNDGKWVWR